MKKFVVGVFWTLDETQHPSRDKALAELGIAKSCPVTHVFVGHAA